MARVKVIRVPETVQVPPGNISSSEWLITKAEAALAPVAKARTLDLADYVDITGTSDGTSGLESALTQAASMDGPATLYLRSGATIKLSGTPNVPDALRNQVRLIGDGPVGAKMVVSHAGPAFQLDPNPTPATATRRQYWRMENLYIEGPGRSVSGSMGLHINNALQGFLANVVVLGFETGVHVDGHDLANGAAAYYNDFFKLVVSSCGTALKVTGQANSNRFHGGSFRLSDIGVHIVNSNNVGFSGSDIEGNTQVGAILDANGNSMYGVRLENNSAPLELQLVGTRNIVVGYIASTHPENRIQWDTDRNNTVLLDKGYFHLGASTSNQSPNVIGAIRTSAADGKPWLDMVDTYSASGNPIGVRYRSHRAGPALLSQRSRDDGETYFDTWRLDSDANGNPQMSTGNQVTGSQSRITWGAGDPEGAVAGRRGDIWMRTNGAAASTMYIKETGDGTNTGWRAV